MSSHDRKKKGASICCPMLARHGLDCQMQGSSLVSFSFDRFFLVNASEVSLRFVG